MSLHELRQISVLLENKAGRLAVIAGALQENGVNILAFTIAEAEGFGVVRIIVDDPAKARRSLEAQGLAVTENRMMALRMLDEPGGLYGISRILGEQDINMEYAYAFNRPGKAILILKVTDINTALPRIEASYPEFLEECSGYQHC